MVSNCSGVGSPSATRPLITSVGVAFTPIRIPSSTSPANNPFRLPAVHTCVEAIDVEPYGARMNFKVWTGEYSLLIGKQPISKFPELSLFTGTLRGIGCQAGRSMHLLWQAGIAFVVEWIRMKNHTHVVGILFDKF